ncbi:MAG: 50S ribosomal protein L35 [Thermodesulfobacteriota bacterium]|nr:MAG: 50S ribosomal protein L35 [Thermodesulfobacteriota bacterium]
MPKVKTNRSAAKRFKLTGSGKVKRARGGGHHLNAKKARKRKRRLNETEFLSGAVAKRIKTYI